MTTKVKHIANNVVTDNQIDLSTIDTGEIAEGSNLYFTNARVDSRLSGGSLGAISHNQGYTQTAGTWQKQGTNGNITIASNGNEVNFSRNAANYLNATGSSASLVLMTNNQTALTLNSGQNAIFAGDVTINGQLSITGNIDQYNVTDLDVTDKTITLGSGQTEAQSGGSGIVIDGSGANLLWDESDNRWEFNKRLLTSSINLSPETTQYAIDATLSYYSASNGVYLNGAGTNGWLRLNASGVSNSRTCIDLYGQNQGDYIKMKAGNADALWINSAGNIGLGESSPDTLLHLKEAGSTSAVNEFLRMENTAGGGAAAGSSINFHHYHAGGGPAGGAKAASITAQNMDSWAGGAPSGYSTGLTFGTIHSNTFAERMRIKSDGKVGIGTTAPSADLHIENGSGATLFMGDTNGRNLRFRTANSGSQNTNISSYAGLYLGGADNQNHMLIDGNGKVGIGTSAPSGSLHVTAKDSSGSDVFIVAQNTTNNRISGYKILDESGSIQGLWRYDNGGNYASLSVGTGAAPTTISLGESSTGISFTSTATNFNSGKVATIRGEVGGTGYGNLAFDTFEGGSGGGERMVILANGNVGIGTGSPAAPLHVLKSSNDVTLLHLSHSSSNASTADYAHYGEILLQGSTHCKSGIRAYSNGYQTANSALAFFTNQHGGSYAERMRIMGDGKVGIGESSPESIFHIKKAASGSSYSADGSDLVIIENNDTVAIDLRSPSSNAGGILFSDTTRARGAIIYYHSIDDMYFNVAGASGAMVLDSSGHLGIGTTSPNADTKLHVAGAVKAEYKTEDSSITGGLVFDTPRYKEYHFNWSGLTNHQVEMTCSSYFMAIVEYMTFQTNGGADIQEYHRGKWANNHTTHTWDEFESSGNTGAITNSISAGQNNVSNSGKLTISETYSSGSYSGSSLIVKVYFGDAGFAISKTT